MQRYLWGLFILMVFACTKGFVDHIYFHYPLFYPEIFRLLYLGTLGLAGLGMILVVSTRSRVFGGIWFLASLLSFYWFPFIGWMFFAAYFRGESVDSEENQLTSYFSWTQMLALVTQGTILTFRYLDTVYPDDQVFVRFQGGLLIYLTAATTLCVFAAMVARYKLVESGVAPWGSVESNTAESSY